MSSNTLISSEQALEEYFSALLDESLEVDEKLDSPENHTDPMFEWSCCLPQQEEESNYAPPAVEVEYPILMMLSDF